VNVVKVFDPYVAVDVDEIQIARTQTRQKTLSPVWNEEMSTKVQSGENINFTVFHDAAIPPDEFVANCKVPFEDIVGEKTSDFWVMLASIVHAVKWFWFCGDCSPGALYVWVYVDYTGQPYEP